MDINWSSEQENINWDDLCRVYEIAPLGKSDPKDLKTVFSNSMFKCFVFDGNRIIGSGRALVDGIDCSYICDIALHPEYQGLGIGKKLVENLIKQSKLHKKIILYANPGKEGFYSRLGFKKMNTAMAIFKNEIKAMEKGIIS